MSQPRDNGSSKPSVAIDPQDEMESQDPQSERASQGFGVALNAGAEHLKNEFAKGQQANKDFMAAARIAAHHNPLMPRTPEQEQAENVLTNDALGMAAGSVQGVGGQLVKNEAKAAAKVLSPTPATKTISGDEAARLARAAEMGFDTSKTYYHGTPNGPFNEFDPNATPRDYSGKIAGFFTKNKKFAEKYSNDPYYASQYTEEAIGDADPHVFKVHLRANNTFDYENPEHVSKLIKQLPDKVLEDLRHETGNKVSEQLKAGDWSLLENPKVLDTIKSLGFDSLHTLEEGNKNIAVFHPNQIRDTKAAFDLKKAASGNINHALGGEIKMAEGGLVPGGGPQYADSQNQAADLKENYGHAKKHKKKHEGGVQHLAHGGQTLDLTHLPSQPIGPAPTVDEGAAPPPEVASFLSAPAPGAASQDPNEPPPEVKSFLREELLNEKYGTAGQQLKAGAEALGRGLVGPLATAAETSLGVKPEDIEGRKEANPVTSVAGEVAGLVAPALLTGGLSAEARLGAEAAGLAGQNALKTAAKYGTLGGLMDVAGTNAAKLVGGEAANASRIAKVGSAAVKGAVEIMVFQTASEADKAVMGDPDAGVQAAIPHILLSGLLGAATGGVLGGGAELWKAKLGPKADAFLSKFKDRVNGEPMQMPGSIEKALIDTGIEPHPVVRAALSGDPEVQKTFNILREGKKQAIVDGIDDLHKQASNRAMEATGLSAADVLEHSQSDLGQETKATLARELKALHEPAEALYEKITAPFQETPLTPSKTTWVPSPNPYAAASEGVSHTVPGTVDLISDKLGQLAQEKGWMAPDMPQGRIVNYVMKALPEKKNIEGLRQLISNVGELTHADPVLRHAGREIKDVLQAEMEAALDSAVSSSKNAGLFNQYKAAQRAYADASKVREELAGNLGVGRPGGVKDMISRIESKLAPEAVLSRLSPKNNAEIIPFLAKHFPQTLEAVRVSELRKLLVQGVLKADKDLPINVKVLGNAIDRLSPEQKAFVLSEGSAKTIQGARTLLDSIPEFKSSGTAGWLDSLWGHFPASATAAAALLTGHSPAAGWAVGQAAKVIARDVPDAIRLGMLKFLGSDAPVNAPAFRAMVNKIHAMQQGEAMTSRAAQNVFRAAPVLSPGHIPSAASKVKLDKMAASYQNDQEKALEMGKETAHYLPEHSAASGKMQIAAVNYLNSLRPVAKRLGPLDRPAPITREAQAAYDRALTIAQQPLTVLQKVKDGSVTPQDIVTLKTLYPALYTSMSTKLVSNMTDAISKGELVPYKTKVGLSMFLGQPLDSTMTPAAIQSAQMVHSGQLQSQAPGAQQPQAPSGKHSMAALNKLAPAYKTQAQAAEGRRALK